MKIPIFHETFIPILEVLDANQGTLNYKDLRISVRDQNYSSLPQHLLDEQISTGKNKLFDRIDWGKSYLKMGKFVSYPNRGMVEITEKGRKQLKTGSLTWEELQNDIDYIEHCESRQTKKEEETEGKNIEDFTPQDLIDYGFNAIKEEIKSNLLERLRTMDPFDFEEVVIGVFKEMNYGETTVTKKTHDGGIDGIINQDELGLEKIYVQVKRYKQDNKVNEREIRDFIGAMSGNTTKGIFVTTSSFDDSAITKAKSNTTIILIDGDKLVDLMYEHEVGIQVRNTYKLYKLKEVDEDIIN